MTYPQAENFGTVPNASANFGSVPNDSESFRSVRKVSERTENHTLTVREVTRQFEQSGVPRTERSIINWCQPNRQGVARLDAFFDENERRYYITPESVSRAIEEERARQTTKETEPKLETEFPKGSEPRVASSPAGATSDFKELERQNRDLEIATRAKDFYIERLEKERGQFVDRMVGMSRYVGELETQVFQLGGEPRGDRTLPTRSEESHATRTGERIGNDYPQGGVAL